MPHSTGVNWSRLSAKARSKPSRRSTTACARAFSIPIASRVASRGAVRCAIMPGRLRPEGRKKTSGRSTATSPPQPTSSHSRAGGSRPSRVQAVSHRSSRTCRDESLGSQSNGSPPGSGAAGRSGPAWESSPFDRSRAFRGSTDVTPQASGDESIARTRDPGSYPTRVGFVHRSSRSGPANRRPCVQNAARVLGRSP